MRRSVLYSARHLLVLAVVVVFELLSAGTTSAGPGRSPPVTVRAGGRDLQPRVCGNASVLVGPRSPPPGSVVVPPGDDRSRRLDRPHTTYWFAPGVHLLGLSPSSHIAPSTGDSYLGGPGAIIDGTDVDTFAFTHRAHDVTIRYLTIENFTASPGRAAVNADGGAHWVIENDTVRGTKDGAGLRLGPGSTTANDCLTWNRQGAFLATTGRSTADLSHNERTRNGLAPSTMNLGVYAGPANVLGVNRFAQATGARITVASDFLPQNAGWSGLDGQGGSLRWLTSAWAGTGDTVFLGVPMIPTDASGTPLGTLAGGAAGDYDAAFVTLAQTLVSGGLGSAYLRLGPEFDGTWTPWAVTNATDAANFAAYWRNIVTAMRSVPGADFRFVWNPAGFQAITWKLATAYPGNADVDAVGFDLYDWSWDSSCLPGGNPDNAATATESNCVFNEMRSQPDGLDWLVSFARSHHKPIAIPEWGVAIRHDGHGLGDDPIFMSNTYHWMTENHVAFAIYWDHDDLGDQSAILDGRFPEAAAVFEADFGGSRHTVAEGSCDCAVNRRVTSTTRAVMAADAIGDRGTIGTDRRFDNFIAFIADRRSRWLIYPFRYNALIPHGIFMGDPVSGSTAPTIS